MRMRRVSRSSAGRGGPALAVLLTTAAVAWLPPLPALAPALAVGLVAPGQSAAQGIAAAESDLVALARTYTAAWNAHDLEAALACFAPDAVIEYRAAGPPDAVWEAAGHGEDTSGRALIPGTEAIRAHLRAQFRWQGHVETWTYRATGDVVTWSYRQREAPEQHLPGLRPVEGTAAASVRAGRITRLSLVHDPASVAARATAVAALAPRRVVHPDAPGTGGVALGRSAAGPAPGGAARPAPGASDAAWPLGLAGFGAGAALLAGRRRRRTHQG
jgi:ketosteroid isomerase-like protein